jgi:hypothetical protein
MGRSLKDLKLYKKFREEAKLVIFKSETKYRRVVRWNTRVFNTGSFKNVFEIVKNEIKI